MEKIFKYIEPLVISCLMIFAPIKSMIIAVLVLTLVDLVIGVIAAKKQSIPITSSGLKRTIAKIFLYELAVLVSFIAETYLIDSIIPLTKLVAGLVGVTEVKSIFENLDIINGASLFNSLINKLLQSEEDKLK